ncbi:OmpP1/FadL family transporter [Olleya aquimaris]|uniref:Outer membrane protein transport protein (OMPP1/FadL/TodX) n=1 Tax=Olleya aquimaris TaxID=639310 RepID=A0A327RBD2_9FLAO|nr:outer membrane protein transport protein [Olleya aquimaris]RAJ13282.1 outer membrane protein transport protein (OMPP1/FadL/TodX) [Olleya aquimaris]
MKKLIMLVIGTLSMSISQAQDINDALRYTDGTIKGSARFQAMGGAFGALGGDLSAISLNPAGSAVFTTSFASISLGSDNKDNNTNYFNGNRNSSNSTIDLTQGGAVFVFKNQNNNSPWRKFSLGLAFDNTKNYEDDWRAIGTGNTSIGNYFLANAQGLRLDEISAFDGETTSEAYSEIGSAYGYQHQQAFLGYDSYILEPDSFDDDNTNYSSNIAGNSFQQNYLYTSTGYNGKISFNMAAQYEDDIYLGLNLNSHFLNYNRFTSLFESNSNVNSSVSEVLFDNTLTTNGSGFSFQLGSIFKLTNELRAGFTYDSPTWMTIREETTQYLETLVLDDTNGDFYQIVDPNILNVFPSYRIQSPSKITGSLAYVFGTQGLISFDYSRRDFSKTKFKPTSDAYFDLQNTIIENTLTAASTYRIGAEYKVKQFSFRGGYRFEESPYADGSTIGDLTGYSLGLGYNFNSVNLDLAYSNSNQERNEQLYNVGLTNAANINNDNTNITLTLGFKL